ncbi:MAG: potassium channel family protein [Candidatus Competibacteraceae bacterium]
MLKLTLIALFIVALTVIVHAVGTSYWIRFVLHHYADHDGYFKPHKTLPALIWTAVVLMLLHLTEVGLWALTYRLLPEIQLDTFEKAAYFSLVTFTTVGYGDVTLSETKWRLLSGMEALDGILLVGWSTALLFMIVQRSWKVSDPIIRNNPMIERANHLNRSALCKRPDNPWRVDTRQNGVSTVMPPTGPTARSNRKTL